MFLEVIIGPMFSGKTTELIRRLSRYKMINKKILILGHSIDNRYEYSNYICSHDNNKEKCIKTDKLKNILEMKEFKDSNVIGIDEGQFFTDLRYFILQCEKLNKDVIVSGLDGNYRREPFDTMMSIIPLSDTVIKLSALCKMKNDGTPAIFSKKISNSKNIIDIGSSDKYIPVCREMYLK
jgi:thymidine kinase